MADKALILGINHYKNVNPLRGCLADADTMKGMLAEVFKFAGKNIRVLKDEEVVKSEVLKQLDWLFQGAKPGDRAVLHFSGHGSYVDDKNGDEPDGRDELIALHDMDFDDPNSYLLDDELRDWTKQKPAGVELTVVLDNCNSGTGTRMLMAAAKGVAHRRAEVDPKATVRRTLAGAPAIQDSEVAEVAAEAMTPENPNVVRVRFLDPPQAIKDKVERALAKVEKARGFVKVKDLNHVLLAACRDDQTAADATIDGKPCGAFTHFLDRTIRAAGSSLRRRAMIDQIAVALRNGHFDQVPQLEGPGDGPLFMANDAPTPLATPATPTPRADRQGASADDSTFLAMLDKLAPLDPESRRRVLDLYEGIQPVGPRSARAVRSSSLAGQRILVNVHGICKHVSGFSDEWWASLHPYTNEFGDGTLGQSRREVLWSDLVNERGLKARGLDEEQKALKVQILESLQDRLDRHAIDSGPRSLPGEAPRSLSDTRGLISIPGLNCIDDFLVYLTDDGVRAQILGRFTEEVRPLLEGGAEVDVVSHSWGTVVAYEGLRELADKDGLTAPRVRNFFTVGAALSIGAVKFRLRSSNKDGARPAMARRWVNLDAHGDPVGGPLQGRPYAVDFDFPNLDAFGCASFLGIVKPSCAHGSYFKSGNVATNRDIFAHFINQP